MPSVKRDTTDPTSKVHSEVVVTRRTTLALEALREEEQPTFVWAGFNAAARTTVSWLQEEAVVEHVRKETPILFTVESTVAVIEVMEVVLKVVQLIVIRTT